MIMFSRKSLRGVKKLGAVILSVCMIVSLFTGFSISSATEPVETVDAIFIGKTGAERQAATFIPVDIAEEGNDTEEGNALEGENHFKLIFDCKMLSGTKPIIGVLRVRNSEGDPSGSANAVFSEPEWCDNSTVTVEDGVCTADITVVFDKRRNPNGEGFRSFYIVIGNSYFDGTTTTAGDFDDSFIMSNPTLYYMDEGEIIDENLLPEFNASSINFNGTYFFRSENGDQWDSLLGSSAMQWHVLASPAYVKQVKVPADFNTSAGYSAESFVKYEATDFTREYYTNESYPDTYFAKIRNSADAGFEIINDINKKMVIIEANHEGEEDVIADETIPQLNKAGNIFLPISLGQYTLQGGATTDKNVILKVTFKADRLEGDAAPVLGRIVGKKSGTSGRGSQGWGLSTNNVRNAAYYKNYKRSDNGGGVRPQCTYDPETGEFVGWVGMSTSNNGNATRWGTNEVLTIGNAEHVYEEGKFDSTSFNSSFAISDIKVDLYDVSVSDNVHTVTDLIAEDIAPQLYAETVDDTSNWAYQYTGSASNHDHDPIRASQYKWSVDGCTGMVHAENLTSCISEGHTLTHHEATDVTREYWSCSCGKTFADSFAKTEITDISAKKQAIQIAASKNPASAFTTVKLAGFNGCQWYKFTCKVKRTGEKDPEVSTLYAKYNGTNACEATAGGDNAVIESSYDPETGILTGYIMGWLPPDPGKTDHYNMKTRYPYLRYNPISGANIAILIGNGHYVGDGGYVGDSVDTEITIGEPELYKVNCTTYDASAVDEAKAAENIGDNLIAPITDKTVNFENEYVATWTNGNNPLAAPMGKWYRLGKDEENITAKNIPANYFTPGYVPCEHAASHVVEAVASTCHTQGHGAYTVCDSCGEVLEGSDAPLPLDPSNHDGGTEIRDAATATCTATGYTGDTYCLGCEAKIAEGTTINMLAHTPGNTVNENVVPATCGANGSHDEVVYCTECETELSRVTKTDLATGNHTVGDWNFDASNHWHYCTVGEQNVDTAAHTLTWVVVTPATLEADGLKKEVCSVCGYETGNTEVINKLENHKPGDINDDGVVNNKDLTRLFQKLSGLNVKVNDAALDVNGDGKKNNKDITTLFKYLSGWDNITLS